MRKKCLITLAAIAVLTAQCVHATTITGATVNGTTYTINPEKASQNVAYRKYTDFSLDQGHVANLNFNGREAFINLVDKQVNIGGILNSVDANGNFFNGHAIFISPNGMVVGDQGVLNVGRLSVATPNATKYNSLVSDYANDAYTEINKISKLKQDGNGPITVNGYIFTNRGADLRGSTIAVSGKIVNGVTDQAKLTTKAAADDLFATLVNAEGIPAKTTTITDGNALLIKSFSGDGIDISGSVINLDKNHDLAITNKAGAGMNVSGTVAGQNATVLLNNEKGAQTISGKVYSPTKVAISNRGTGALKFEAGSKAQANEVHIVNSNGSGLTFDGTAQGKNATYLYNKKGALAIGGNVGSTAGKTSIYNYGTTLTNTGTIANTGGNLIVRNEGTGNMELGGTVQNNNVTAISNTNAGDLNVTAKITNTGNLGIVNRASAGGLTVAQNAVIKNNNGDTKVVNHGAAGETINGTITGNGATYVYNKGGKLAVNGTVTNNGSNLYVFNKGNSTGLNIGDEAVIATAGGSLSIKNNGKATGNDGLTIGNATIRNNGTGETAINNYTSGNLSTNGNIIVNGKLGIINREKGGQMDVFSEIVNTSTASKELRTPVTNIKQNGTGAMNVGGKLTNAGTAHVVANNGKLTLSQKVNNAAPYYAVARKNATGLETTAEFSATGTDQVLIKNISGANGLTHNGTINITNGQAAVVSHQGDLNINGTVKSTGGRARVRNAGAGVNLNTGSLLQSDTETKVINVGTKAAKMNGTVKAPSSQTFPVLHEKLAE